MIGEGSYNFLYNNRGGGGHPQKKKYIGGGGVISEIFCTRPPAISK